MNENALATVRNERIGFVFRSSTCCPRARRWRMWENCA